MSKALQEKLRHVLVNTVGSIVELPESALSVAVLSGKASLGPNLKIKKDVFEQLGLPVVLTAGSIESIDIDIPTTSLRTKPVVVRIKEVLITLSPNPDANTRRAKLAAQERLWQQAAEEGEGVDPESAMGKMVQKIVDNIHIIAEDVHIRLEDTRTQSESYALGMVLDRFSLRSYVVNRAGATWAETCAKPVQRFLSKCLVFGDDDARHGESGLGIYVQPGEAPMANPGGEAWRAAMLGYIMRPERGSKSTAPVSWVVGPSVVKTRVSIDKQEGFEGCFSRCWNATEGAKQEIQLFVANLPVKLRHTALRNLYGLLFFYQNVSRWQRFVQSRPACPVHGNAREWWQFAIKCELAEINRKTISVKTLSKVTQDGRDYVAVYSRKAGAGRPWLTAPDAEESARLQAFEDRYPADVTKTFRIRAWRLLLDGDKERQGQIQEERDVQNALLAAPSGRWGRTDLHSNFFVEYSGMVSHEIAGGSARKKAKESYAVIVSLNKDGIPRLREGWLERRTAKDGAKWEKRYCVLTADEFYHSAKAAGAKKFRTPLSSCQKPAERPRGFEFELKAKDTTFVLRCEDDASRKAWVKDIEESITKRSTVETIVFDPTKHLADANLDNISFTLHVKMEAASPAKSSFRKKKPAMDDILLHLTPDAFMICSFQPISDEAAETLTDLQVVRLDRGEEGSGIHRVTTRFTFKRLRTWSLEQNSACCKVEVTQTAGNLTALRFFSSDVCTADEVMEAIQQCIASVIAKQKRAKERRAEIKGQVVALFEQHEPDRLAEVDELMKGHPGQKAEELLQQLSSQYTAVASPSSGTESAAGTDTSTPDIRVTFEKEGPLGISFGSESDDTIGWIDAIKPNGLASEFTSLKNGLLLVAVQDQPVSSYQQAIDAIMAAERPLHLSFRDKAVSGTPPRMEASSESPPEPEPQAESEREESGGADDTSAVTTSTEAEQVETPVSKSRWLLRYATGSEDGAVEAIHLATYMSDTPLRPRKEYAYETALTVKHLDGLVHRFTIATADEKSSAKMGQIIDSGASKAIDLSSTPTVTPAQEELLDTMDVLQSFSFTASYTGPEEDDDDTPRASIRESRRPSPAAAGSGSSEMLQPADCVAPSNFMYDAITHASIHVELVDIDFSMATYDICKLKAAGVSVDAMYNLHGAKRKSLAIADATVIDMYSRDSVFEKIVCAIEPAGSGSVMEPDNEDGWHAVDTSADSLARASNSYDITPRGRRASTEDVTMEEPSPGASSVEDTWLMAPPVHNPMLFCEHEQAADASVQLGEAPYAKSTVCKIKPVRLVANCALLPVLQDFIKLQDFKVMQAATSKALGRIDKIRNDHDAARAAKATRFYDISIAGPELILPESPAISEEDTSVFVCTAAELSLKTDSPADGDTTVSPTESIQTASFSALQAFTCTRSIWLQTVAAQEQRAKEVPLWLWLEPTSDATGEPIPMPFSVAMCTKLEAAVAAGADSCGNDDETTDSSVVQLRSVPSFDVPCIDPELGQAAKIFSGSAEKGDLKYCQVYRDIAAGKDSRPQAVEHFFDEFRVHKEPAEMEAYRANGILLPCSATARIKRNDDLASQRSLEAPGLEILCEADRIQLQLSGKIMKEMLVIAIHAVEAASSHHASLARVVKTMLYEQRSWPWKRKRSSKAAKGADGSSSPVFVGILKKLLPTSKLSKLHGVAETLRTGLGASKQGGSSDVATESSPGEEASEAVPTPPADGTALLLSAQLKLNLVDITLKGEPRGSDSSIEPLTLGVRAHGVDTGLVLSTAESRTHCALEGVEVMHSQADAAEGPDGRNFTAWPHAGLSMVRPEATAHQPGQPSVKMVVEAYTTGESEKRIELHSAKDLLSVVDAKELARLLPIASTVIGESERVISLVKPMAARVGLAAKIPGVPAKYSEFLQELTGATASATDDMEAVVADQAAAVAEIRAKLRTLVDQQVAKYSALAEGVISGLDKGTAAGQIGSTVTELAAGAIRGETDGFEKAKADLRTQVGGVAREKIEALSAEIDKEIEEGSLHGESNSIKAKVSKVVMGGAQQLVEAAMSADGLDVPQMRELVREQTATLEAEIKGEVEKQLAARVSELKLDQLGDEAVSPVLQKENARLVAQLELLARENEKLKAELLAAQGAGQ
jgi:hypothetical protein